MITPETITVGILTFRRPDRLAAALPAVLEQLAAADGNPATEVLVVDNDPAGSARIVAVRFTDQGVRYVIEPEPGIAAARNRALAETAHAALLIFLDDDEVPQPDWLDALLRTWRIHRPAAVMGRVLSVFDHDLDPWVAAGEFFRRRRMPTGTEIGVAATGNLLLDLDQVRDARLRFDPGLGLGGGEDTLFTRQLHAAGGRIVWCDESVAIDTVPPTRTTRRWVLARSFSQGNTQVVVDLRLADGGVGRALVRLRSVVRGLLRIAGGLARAAVGLITRSLRHRARGWRTVCRGAGMITAALGSRHHEYARP